MGSEKTELLGGGITPAQLSAWKSKHEKVFAIEVDVDDEGKDVATGYFKRPDLAIISLASREENDKLKSNKVIYTNCWLGGDERLLKDDVLMLSAMNQIKKLVDIRVSRIKNV